MNRAKAPVWWLDRVLASPHRLMFVAAGLWALAVVGLTAWPGQADRAASPMGTLAGWHAHEMVFGFAAAGFAGYALTAMGSWSATGRPTRASVLVLCVAWVLGRLSVWGCLGQDPHMVVPAGVAFMGTVTLTLATAAVRARARRGAVQALFAALLTGAQAAILCGAPWQEVSVLGFGLLLSVVGGRMVAAFTWNRLARSPAQARRFLWARKLGLLSSIALSLELLLELSGYGDAGLSVRLLLVSSAAESMRLMLWQSRQTWCSCLLGMLHAGYFWLPLGLALVAASRALPAAFPPGDSVHGLAAGAVACSIYAVAARALARRAESLCADFVDVLGFGLLWLSAALRVLAPLIPVWGAMAPILWCAAWLLFLSRHGAALASPMPHPVFSGPRH